MNRDASTYNVRLYDCKEEQDFTSENQLPLRINLGRVIRQNMISESFHIHHSMLKTGKHSGLFPSVGAPGKGLKLRDTKKCYVTSRPQAAHEVNNKSASEQTTNLIKQCLLEWGAKIRDDWLSGTAAWSVNTKHTAYHHKHLRANRHCGGGVMAWAWTLADTDELHFIPQYFQDKCEVKWSLRKHRIEDGCACFPQ